RERNRVSVRHRQVASGRWAPTTRAPETRLAVLVQSLPAPNPEAPAPQVSTVLPWFVSSPGLPGRRAGAQGRIVRVGRIGRKPGMLEFFRRDGAIGKVARVLARG